MVRTSSLIICRFPYSSQLGGEELHTFNLALFLRSRNYNVSFLTSCRYLRHFAHKNSFAVRKVWLFMPPVSISTYILFTTLFPILTLWSFFIVLMLKITKPRVHLYCLSFTEKLLFAPWCFLFRIPTTWVEHARIDNWFYRNVWKHWYYFWLDNKIIKVVTVSEVMRTALKSNKVTVIPNAIETKPFQQKQKLSILPKSLQTKLKSNKTVVGFVGRLESDKGMEILIDCVKKIPKATFIAIGKGSYKTNLINHGIPVFDYLDEKQIAAFMQHIDIFCLPASKTDPFGLVVLEALSSKCATIITDKVGIVDYLEPNKEIIVSTENTFFKDLSDLIQDKQKREELQKNGFQAVARFDVQKMFKSYEEIIFRT